jgi:hypothetical protein
VGPFQHDTTDGRRDADAFREVSRLTRRVDTEALLEWLGALALDPRNAMAQLVLEAVAHVAVAADLGRQSARPRESDVRRVAARGFRLIPSPLDPPEQPFASTALFRRTALTAPNGLVTGSAYELARSLEVIEGLAEHEPAMDELAEAAELVLQLVGRITARAGLAGIVEPAGRHDRVTIPPADSASRLRHAIRLAPSDLLELGGEGWRRRLDPLIATVAPADVTWDGSDGTLSYRPFIPTAEGGVLLAVPGMVIPALDRFLRSTVAAHHSDWPALRENALWTDVDRSLGLLRIRPLEGVTGEGRDGHRLYRIDEEQLLSVVLASDGGASDEAAVGDARRDLAGRGGEHVLIVLFAPEAGEHAFFGLDAPPAGIAELLMKPEELSVFARVEAGEPRSLADFAQASSAIRDEVRVFSWCAIDEFAIYRDHQSSYYLSDEGRPTLLTVQSGSALKLRLEAARRSEMDLVTSPTGRATVVMRRWDDHDGIWGPTTPLLGQGACLVRADPPVWVLTPPYADIDPSLVDGWLSVMDAVAYWVFEAREVIGRMLRFAELPFAIVTVEGVDAWTKPPRGDDPGVIRLRLVEDDHVLRVRLERGFADLTQSPDNTADRQLLSAILEGLAGLTAYPDLDDAARTIEEVAPAGHKKMVIVLDVAANPDIGPNDVPRWRRVRDAPVAVVLDELGQALQQRGWTLPTDEFTVEPTRILNDAVSVLLTKLSEEVQEFDPSLLDTLLLRNEAILRERADAGFHLIPRLACFPGELADAQKRVDGLDAASVAGRFLIEYVAARPPAGGRLPSLGAVDRLTAIADVLLGRGHASDLEHLGLAKTNARMLASGRLGLDDRAMSAAWRAFAPSVQLSRADEARQSFMSRWRSGTAGPSSDLEALDAACAAEWGYSFGDLARVIGAAVSISISDGSPVQSLPAGTAVEILAREAEVAPAIAGAVLEQLTLEPRDDYLVPPAGFGLSDLYPWRYNRGLSILRRPFVLRPRGGTPEIVFGRRALLESLHYLLELIETSRLRPRSRAMADYIGRKSRERGRAFNDRVADELSGILGTPVRRRVTKVGSVTIADERGPLGDIDVLAIDQGARVIWAVECKSLAPSRTPAEVANELRDLYGEDGRPGHIGKHTRLVQWLGEHRGQVTEELGLEGDWRIEGLFVVDDDLYGPYFREAPIPVIPLRRLDEFVRSGGRAGSSTHSVAGRKRRA